MKGLFQKYARGDGVGRGGVTSCTPSKGFEKFGLKNAIKHENRGPPLIFSQPTYPLKRI
jgi:hypothetical protein